MDKIWQRKSTVIFDVKGSYPVPAEAKHTPVGKSLSRRLGSRYAGTSFLTPNRSAKIEETITLN